MLLCRPCGTLYAKYSSLFTLLCHAAASPRRNNLKMIGPSINDNRSGRHIVLTFEIGTFYFSFVVDWPPHRAEFVIFIITVI